MIIHVMRNWLVEHDIAHFDNWDNYYVLYCTITLRNKKCFYTLDYRLFSSLLSLIVIYLVMRSSTCCSELLNIIAYIMLRWDLSRITFLAKVLRVLYLIEFLFDYDEDASFLSDLVTLKYIDNSCNSQDSSSSKRCRWMLDLSSINIQLIGIHEDFDVDVEKK